MQYDDVLIKIFYQTISIVLVIMIQSFFYKGKDFKYLSQKRFLVSLPIILAIIIMFLFGFGNTLSLYIIVLTMSVFYLGLKQSLFIYLWFVVGHILSEHNINLIILYMMIILVTKLCLIWIEHYHKRLITVYVISMVFLNIELYLIHNILIYYMILNLAGLIIWGIVIYLTSYFHKKNVEYLHYQQKNCIDNTTKMKNYYCLLKQSYHLLRNEKSHISLLLINVDRLKDINSLYGNHCGDEVIKIVANCIKDNVNGYGFVYRLAGDTFCVIAINEKFKMMQTISERIRLRIELKDIIIDNNKIKISVSVGGYYGKIDSKNIDDYIEVAQDSLLNSKYSGRNRVFLNNQMVYYPNIM